MTAKADSLHPDCREAYKESLLLLKSLITRHGFVASAQDIANYRRIWSRDSVIAGLAALSSGQTELIHGFRLSLETLKSHQDKTGRLASNIEPDKNQISFGTTVGRIDATLWYVIGACQYALVMQDPLFWRDFRPSVERALFYLECLELNGRGLLHIPPGGDWADEYINHGYVLFDQMLYWIAGRLYGRLVADPVRQEKNKVLAELIKMNYFPKAENATSPYVYHQVIFKKALAEYKPPIPVTYFTAHSIRYHLDTFASSLLLLADLLEEGDEKMVAAALLDLAADPDLPVIPAFHPVIDKVHPLWPRLEHNYLYEFKNKPYHFHNGGRWPLVHGFFLAALGEAASAELVRFAGRLRGDGFIFPEFYHGQTGEPLGTQRLGFSAAGYILAHNMIINDRPPFALK